MRFKAKRQNRWKLGNYLYSKQEKLFCCIKVLWKTRSRIPLSSNTSNLCLKVNTILEQTLADIQFFEKSPRILCKVFLNAIWSLNYFLLEISQNTNLQDLEIAVNSVEETQNERLKKQETNWGLFYVIYNRKLICLKIISNDNVHDCAILCCNGKRNIFVNCPCVLEGGCRGMDNGHYQAGLSPGWWSSAAAWNTFWGTCQRGHQWIGRPLQ